MNKHNLIILTSLIMFILPTASYSGTDQAILFQCSLKQRTPFDINWKAFKILPLSKNLNIEFLFYKEKREAFIKIENSNRWDESSIFVNPDYYGFRNRIDSDRGGFLTEFYIDRRNLSIYTDKVTSSFYYDLERYWKSLSDERKLADYGDVINSFQFFGDCKIGSYSEPQI